MPAFVEPALATTAKGPSGSVLSSADDSADPVSRPRSSCATVSRSTSITRAADATDEWTVSAHAICQRGGRAPPRAVVAACRAATSADRLPAVPPETKQPPASAGMPARSAIHRSTWFSAHTAPPPSSQLPP